MANAEHWRAGMVRLNPCSKGLSMVLSRVYGVNWRSRHQYVRNLSDNQRVVPSFNLPFARKTVSVISTNRLLGLSAKNANQLPKKRLGTSCT